jgi:hypothetical protein
MIFQQPLDEHRSIPQVIGAGFGTYDWSDERGEGVDRAFGIDCEFPTGQYYRRRRP